MACAWGSRSDGHDAAEDLPEIAVIDIWDPDRPGLAT